MKNVYFREKHSNEKANDLARDGDILNETILDETEAVALGCLLGQPWRRHQRLISSFKQNLKGSSNALLLI